MKVQMQEIESRRYRHLADEGHQNIVYLEQYATI